MGCYILKLVYVNLILFFNRGYKLFFDFFNTPDKEIVKEEKKENSSLKKVPNSMLHLVPQGHVDNNFYNFSSSQKRRDICFSCNAKLKASHKQYFYYDNEYCINCWNKINLK